MLVAAGHWCFSSFLSILVKKVVLLPVKCQWTVWVREGKLSSQIPPRAEDVWVIYQHSSVVICWLDLVAHSVMHSLLLLLVVIVRVVIMMIVVVMDIKRWWSVLLRVLLGCEAVWARHCPNNNNNQKQNHQSHTLMTNKAKQVIDWLPECPGVISSQCKQTPRAI